MSEPTTCEEPGCVFEAHGMIEEMQHMTTAHPDVVARRLREAEINRDDLERINEELSVKLPRETLETGMTAAIQEAARLSNQIVELRRDASEFVNELLVNAPDSWDDDAAAEAIAIEYVRRLEADVVKLGGSLERHE